jgi:S1-C subfamily serine protease
MLIFTSLSGASLSSCTVTEKIEWASRGGSKSNGNVILGIDVPPKMGLRETIVKWDAKQANELAAKGCQNWGYVGAEHFNRPLPAQLTCHGKGISPCWSKTYRITYQCISAPPSSDTAVKKLPPPSSTTTGSGFFVSKLGHIVTNEHVVRKCGSVTVGDNATKQVTASVLETDKRNDLALLRISSTKMASAETKSLISKLNVQKLGLKLVPLASGGLVRSEDVELGEDVLVAGYPYGELFSNTIKVTKGIVSASRGMGDDSGQFQMDAAVQPGNSGGPIYDANGNIVGVVVSQLNKLKVAKAIGSMPENVNFGIKASTVRQFLTSAGLPTKWSNRTERKSTKELAQIAKNQTVMVVCNP